jgi:putative ABC transport system permease protein
MERSGLPLLNRQIGDTMLVEMPDGDMRELQISGVVHDMHQWPTPLIGTVYAYINFDTAEWLGEPYEFNQINMLVAGDSDSKAHNEAVAEEVYDKVQRAGLEPSFPQVPTPGEHPLNFLIVSITSLMTVMSVLAILLSGFLVANTIGALLAQQTRQIGVMKAVGARASQIIGMYLVLVICFGLLALLPAIPLAQFVTYHFTRVIASLVNLRVEAIDIQPLAIGLQVAISLLVPVLAALGPTIAGTRVTVREALSSQGGAGSYGRGLLDRLMRHIHGLPRPVLLSLRNTFRRKLRLLTTLVTLTLGGAIFISVFSVRDSLWQTSTDFTEALYNYEFHIFLERSYRADYLASRAEQVPGVILAESQVQTNVRRVLEGDSRGESVTLFGVPPETKTMIPQILEGRWLLPADENALVASTGLLNKNPDLAVGDQIVLEIEGQEVPWRIVGLIPAIGDASWAYVHYDYYGRVTHDVNQSSYLRVVAKAQTLSEQQALAAAVEEHFQRLGINVLYSETMAKLRQQDQEVIGVMIASLLSMAVLVALVGGLGLAGLMSLNVIERVREIGVMRAIGAADGAVLQVFIVEGIFIGLLSWMLSALAAVPISRLLSDSMGMLLFSMPLSYSFSLAGVFLWLALSVLIAAVASYIPARNATSLSVAQVLAHE